MKVIYKETLWAEDLFKDLTLILRDILKKIPKYAFELFQTTNRVIIKQLCF